MRLKNRNKTFDSNGLKDLYYRFSYSCLYYKYVSIDSQDFSAIYIPRWSLGQSLPLLIDNSILLFQSFSERNHGDLIQEAASDLQLRSQLDYTEVHTSLLTHFSWLRSMSSCSITDTEKSLWEILSAQAIIYVYGNFEDFQF